MWKCDRCGTLIYDEFDACWKCSSENLNEIQNSLSSISSTPQKPIDESQIIRNQNEALPNSPEAIKEAFWGKVDSGSKLVGIWAVCAFISALISILAQGFHNFLIGLTGAVTGYIYFSFFLGEQWSRKYLIPIPLVVDIIWTGYFYFQFNRDMTIVVIGGIFEFIFFLIKLLILRNTSPTFLLID